MNTSTRWLLYTLYRVGLFAAATVVLSLLGFEVWVAAVLGTIIAFCVAYLTARRTRESLASDLHDRRMRDQPDEDNDYENEILDSTAR